ncbi:GNAT family N-acetyltransferase [Streptomyces celluloflavus]|uniref:GNAT family N-acetyltransferase n=1 Tax=Streptomyces celluloflavus TaxID=58344 RepID=A0ABW7RG78_9ACTN
MSRDTGAARTSRDAVEIRRAMAGDAKRLTRMVRTSRAYEGHYASMVAGYQVGPDYIEAHRVFVAVAGDGGAADGGGRVLGFYGLLLDRAELDLMFVADDAQGYGIGRRLIAHMLEEARRAGLTGVRVVSHPPSEGFYRSVGAVRTGTVPPNPPVVPWERPELSFPVGDEAR